MAREMRRKRQAMPQDEIDAVLERGTSGVLALAGDDGYPYAVPLSYAYDGRSIFLHSAKAGYKLDIIRRSPKASFCVIGQDLIVPGEFTTYFQSVIAFGTVSIMEDEARRRAAIERLAAKYAPDSDAAARAGAIEREWDQLCMLEMRIERVTGKKAIELVRAHEG